MPELTGKFVVKNKKGWHARPCSRVVRLFKSYPNVIGFFEKIGYSYERASGNSIFELMKLGLNYGDEVCYNLQGKDEIEIYTLAKDLLILNEKIAREEELENNYRFI